MAEQLKTLEDNEGVDALETLRKFKVTKKAEVSNIFSVRSKRYIEPVVSLWSLLVSTFNCMRNGDIMKTQMSLSQLGIVDDMSKYHITLNNYYLVDRIQA